MTYSGATTFDIRPGRFANSGFDQGDDMLRIKSVQKKFRDSFTAASVNTSNWSTSVGTGGSITQTAGTLVMASGTTANATTAVTGKIVFTIPFRVSIGLTLSQRIANQDFYVELISVDDKGVPDGRHSCAWIFNGTTATNGIYSVQNGGLSPLLSAASTVVTTASGGLYEIEPFADEAWFHSSTLDSNGGRANSYRRHQQTPDPNARYVCRLRWVNGATPPASSTTATIQFIAIQDYAELTAEITAGRGQNIAGQALGVNVVGTASATLAAGTAAVGDVGVQYRANATGAASTVSVQSPATPAAATIKATAGRLVGYNLQNSSAAVRSVKIFNVAAPTLGTTAAAFEIDIPANGVVFQSIEGGLAFSTAITYSVTSAKGLTDNTATGLAANDVSGFFAFA
jgi:hypothetical protein